MIGYIDNNLDGIWKPCTEEKFYEIVRSQAVARTIAAVRAGNKNKKRALPAFIFCGEAEPEKYRIYAENCRQMGLRLKGSRCAEFLRPTGLFMMDFDRTEGEAMELYRKFLSTMRKAGIPTDGKLALAHRTPSGHGLRLVMRLRPGSNAQTDQKWIAGLMGEPYDAACKDLSRLSYAVTFDDLFYVDGKLLFSSEEAEEKEEAEEAKETKKSEEKEEAEEAKETEKSEEKEEAEEAKETKKSEEKEEAEEAKETEKSEEKEEAEEAPIIPLNPLNPINPLNPPNPINPLNPINPPNPKSSLTFKGIPYATIIDEWFAATGGEPVKGERNDRLHRLAAHLRYICDDDEQLMLSIIPRYGLEEAEIRALIHSAVVAKRCMMPRVMKEILAKHSTRLSSEGGDKASAPQMPKHLPPLIALLVKNVPAHARAAVAHAVFPALGAHLGGVKFRYIDNVDHEATFMCVLLAKMSSGKSAVNKPIEYILADIVERDTMNRRREQQWKDSLNTKGANKEKPKRPDDLCIQVLVSDMTNAAFVQRLSDANGKFLYTSMDELELLDQLKTSSRGNQVSQIIRLAFDQGLYGQERVGSQSVTARVKVKWNWNASSTIQKGKWYFRTALTDGTLSRLNFCTIEPTRSGEIPVYGTYDEAFADELRPYIERLNATTGRVESPEAEALARRLLEENAERSLLTDDEAYEMLSYRANVIAYLKAMTLYIAQGEWTPEIAEFVRWSEEYDLWCKMHFFGEQLRGEMSKENLLVYPGPKNMLEMLPTRFSREEATAVRRAQGKKDSPAMMLQNWKRRGYIVQDEATGEYVKCGKFRNGEDEDVVS